MKLRRERVLAVRQRTIAPRPSQFRVDDRRHDASDGGLVEIVTDASDGGLVEIVTDASDGGRRLVVVLVG